jgi:hypothetical protein
VQLEDDLAKLRLEKTSMEIQLAHLQSTMGQGGYGTADGTNGPIEGVNVKCPNNCGGMLSVHCLQVTAPVKALLTSALIVLFHIRRATWLTGARSES